MKYKILDTIFWASVFMNFGIVFLMFFRIHSQGIFMAVENNLYIRYFEISLVYAFFYLSVFKFLREVTHA